MSSIARRALWITALALSCLAAAAGSAGAVTGVQISPGGAVEGAALGKVTFTGGMATIRCNITVRGELYRELRRITGTSILLGTATGITFSSCEGGTVSAVLSLPWPGFLLELLSRERGGLCNVGHTLEEAPREGLCGGLGTTTGIRFQLSVFGGFVNCLYGNTETAIAGRAPLILVEGRTNQYRVGLATAQTNSVRLTSGGFGCPTTGEFRGTGTDPTFAQTVTFL